MAWTLDLLKRLHNAGLEFVIIGGVAAIAHGSARMTEDLDVCAPVNDDFVNALIRLLADTRPRWRMRPDLPILQENAPNIQGLKNVYLRTDLGQLDVLGELPGVGTYQEIRERSVEVDMFGMPCRVLDIDTLIAAKRFANRPKDMPAVQELELIRKLKQNER
jgi:predicted nucleotidyltransferase